MGFRMKGFNYPGKSPTKQKVSEYATKVRPVEKKEPSSFEQVKRHLTKKHDIYKGKRLSLSGQVPEPKVGVSWKGGPKVGVTGRANLSGEYKLSKKSKLYGGVSYETGKAPQYRLGLNINI